MYLEILKLVLVFFIIIGIMWLKKPLSIAVAAASVAAVLLFQLPVSTAATAVKNGALSSSTIEVLLVLYTLTYLQRMMEDRKNLSNAQLAMNGLFNNRRINVSIVPFILGMLPAASTVIICGPIVRGSVGDELTTEEKACITSYFRHISESFLPTYKTIFIAITLSGGRVTTSSFILAMIPMVILLFAVGWIVYLRKIPKDSGIVPDKPKAFYWKLLVKSIWPIALAIVLILFFRLRVPLAVLICIVVNIFVNRFRPAELISFLRTAFEPKLLISSLLVMIFKEILTATGVVTVMPALFSSLPIPSFLIYALIFFFSAVVAGNQAAVILCMPMAMASLAPGAPGLALFVLLMSIDYVAMQISPVHVCLTLCAEDYGVSLSKMIKKTLPLVTLFTLAVFVYYGILTVLGF